MSWRDTFSPGFFLLGSLLVLVGFLVAGRFLEPDAPAPGFLPIEQRQPVDLDATLETIDGEVVRLDQLEGDVLFLNFWATWCGPCRMEMPSMVNLHNKMVAEGLTIVAITDEDRQIVARYLEENPYPFQILLDPQGALSRRLGVAVLPSTLIVDSQNRMAAAHTGARQWDSPLIRQQFERLIAE